MNERIKELEKQSFITTETQKISGAWDNTVEPFRYVTVTETNFSLEKFAELIVEECMWKIMLRKEEAIDNDWRVDEAMSAAISDISEHFGVEL
jgi:hypothetical protein